MNVKVVYYDWRGRKQRPSFAAVVTCSVILVCASAYALAVGIEALARGDASDEGFGVLNWLDFLYFLSYVKARCWDRVGRASGDVLRVTCGSCVLMVGLRTEQ